LRRLLGRRLVLIVSAVGVIAALVGVAVALAARDDGGAGDGGGERSAGEPAGEGTTSPSTVARPDDGVDVDAACRNEADTANGTAVRDEWPTDATTGPEAGGHDEDFLSPSGVDGKWTITEDGAVIDGKYHHGIVEIDADDVTIRNSVICGVGPHIVLSSGRNLVIENSIVRGERDGVQDAETGTPCQAAVAFGNYTIRNSEITDCNDGLKIGGVVEVYDSWFHDMYTNRFGNGAGTHNDTVQQGDAPLPRFVFEGNSAYQDPCTSNRHFQLAPVERQPATELLEISRNFFYGINGFNLDRGFTVDEGEIVDNTFAGSASRGPFNGLLYAGDGMDSTNMSGNVYESGEPADENPGSRYTCVPG
jgi:hypothetical protein